MTLHGFMVNPDRTMQVDLYTSNSKVENFCVFDKFDKSSIRSPSDKNFQVNFAPY